MNKLLAILLLSCSVLFAADNAGASKNNALGLWVDSSEDDWGLDWKIRQSPDLAMDIYAHFYTSSEKTALAAYMGYYRHHYNVLKLDPEVGKMPLYWGPYGGLGFWDDHVKGLAVRLGVVGGWAWELPASFPLEIWLELNPVAEMHYVWWDDDSDTDWEIPELYFRMGFRAWLF